jgi:hypothetical protein
MSCMFSFFHIEISQMATAPIVRLVPLKSPQEVRVHLGGFCKDY